MGQGHGRVADVDFEHESPDGDEDVAIHERVSGMLTRGNAMLDTMRRYESCSGAIKLAMEDAEKNEGAAMDLVSQRVVLMKQWYDFSKELEEAAPGVLSGMTKTGDLGNRPGLATLMTRLLEFVLTFDEIKMQAPHILNDLAFYRRVLGKARTQPSSPSTRADAVRWSISSC